MHLIKNCIYSHDSCPSQLQSLAEDLQPAGVEGQRDGKLCSLGEGGTDGKDLPVCICMCGSAHDCGCVVMLHECYNPRCTCVVRVHELSVCPCPNSLVFVLQMTHHNKGVKVCGNFCSVAEFKSSSIVRLHESPIFAPLISACALCGLPRVCTSVLFIITDMTR